METTSQTHEGLTLKTVHGRQMQGVKRAAIYVRVSDREQAADDKVSLEIQQRDCEAYCRQKGYGLECMYLEVQSGTDSRKERKRFEEMLKDATQGRFDVIVAWRPDRLFWSQWPAARLKRVMDASGVDVETVTLAMDKKTLGLWAWVAEMEIENIRDRTRMGRESMARAGKLATGNPPYGYCYDPSVQTIRPDEAERRQVEAMFRWVAEGNSITRLVSHFNRLGILTRHGKPWSRQQVVKTLRNPVYKGEARWGARVRRNGRVVKEKPQEGSIIAVKVDPIVTEDLFEKVQRQLGRNRREARRNTRQIYLLQHILWCRVCGKAFVARSHVNRHGVPLKTPERYYGCRGMKNSPGYYNCRHPKELYAATLEAAVWRKVAEAFSDPGALVKMLKARNASSAQEVQRLKERLEEAQRRLRKKELELQHVLAWARQDLLTPEELRPQLAQVREETEHWQVEVAGLTGKLRSLEEGIHNPGDIEAFCARVRDRLGHMTLQEKKEFLRLVVDRIWVDSENNLEIEVVIPQSPRQPQENTLDVICETARSRHRERGKGKLEGCPPDPLAEGPSLSALALSTPTDFPRSPIWLMAIKRRREEGLTLAHHSSSLYYTLNSTLMMSPSFTT